MKKLIFISTITWLAGCGTAEGLKETEVPEDVKSKFAELYPQVRDSDWEMENGMYEAEFDENKTETSVLIDAHGNLQQTEKEIPVSSLPAAISDYVAKNLGGKTIKEAALITSADGTVSYEAEVYDRDYIFDANGNFQEEEQEDGDVEGKDAED